jgi:hypothetical protein
MTTATILASTRAAPEAAGASSGRHARPERACPEPAAATQAEQAARDGAWRRGVGAVAQLGALAGAVDVELRTSGALRSLRLFDAARDPVGLSAALRALDGLRGEVQRVHVTLRSSKLRVLTFDRAEAPWSDRASA